MAKRQNASTGEFVEDNKTTAPKTGGRQTMLLRVQAPYKTYFNDSVYSVSAINSTGPFDILPGHHNFISILNKGNLEIDGASAGHQKILISGGLMHVKTDQVVVFLDV